MAERRLVLVVDDDLYIRWRVREELETDGYAVIEATTAEAGLATAQRERPRLVILDGNFGPGLATGFEVLPQFKEMGFAVIFFSMDAGEGSSARRTAMRLGAAAVVDKESPLAELIETVRRLTADSAE